MLLDANGAEGTPEDGGWATFDSLLSDAGSAAAAPADVAPGRPFAFFGGTKALTQSQVLELGHEAATTLGMGSSDVSCVSITLCHAFGIGSAVGGALMSGGTIVLPEVGGIRGCGDPAQRSEVTLQVLRQTDASLLFADTHTLKALRPLEADAGGLALRGGVVKTGSGSTFLAETCEFAGTTFMTMGKAS